MKQLIYLIIFLSITSTSPAQVLEESTRKEIQLPDGVKITVLASADDEKKYYYIPATLQLAGAGSQPEISLIVYRHGDTGPCEGGLLNFLTQWGLTGIQLQAAAAALQQLTDSTTTLAGAADIEFDEKDKLVILPGTPIADLLIRSASQPIRIPDLAMHKTAASFRLSGEDAARLTEAIGQPQQLKNTRFTAGYYYSIAHHNGPVRTTEKKHAGMEARFDQWISQLIKFHLLKTQVL